MSLMTVFDIKKCEGSPVQDVGYAILEKNSDDPEEYSLWDDKDRYLQYYCDGPNVISSSETFVYFQDKDTAMCYMTSLKSWHIVPEESQPKLTMVKVAAIRRAHAYTHIRVRYDNMSDSNSLSMYGNVSMVPLRVHLADSVVIMEELNYSPLYFHSNVNDT